MKSQGLLCSCIPSVLVHLKTFSPLLISVYSKPLGSGGRASLISSDLDMPKTKGLFFK